MRKTFSGQSAAQEPAELASLIALFQRENVRRYLEIGARHGDTFHAVMSALPAGSLGVAVDLPEAAWGRKDSAAALALAVADLRARGRRAFRILGDSQALETVEKVAALGPFDAALIDADHRYESVKCDWENYSRLALLVAFHDIAPVGLPPGAGIEVPRLWAELQGSFVTAEFVTRGSKMGIGVVWT